MILRSFIAVVACLAALHPASAAEPGSQTAPEPTSQSPGQHRKALG
jgi:hypothetical protein